jgi:hypothetical protein
MPDAPSPAIACIPTGPVNEVVAKAAEHQMTPAELMQAAEALKAQAELQAG